MTDPPDPVPYTPPVYEPQPSPAVPPAKRRVWPWVLGGGIVLFLALVAIGVVVLVNVLVGAVGGSEAQARQTVLDFDRAFEDSDCALFERVTSSSVRDTIYDGAYDCATFEDNAASFRVDGEYRYEVEITSVEAQGDDATVTTTETDGAADEPEPFDFVYTLERSDDGWVITTLE